VFKLLRRRSVLVFLGLLLLSAFIWYAGPFFAFAEFHPLSTELQRLIGIGVLVLWWFLSLLLKIWRSRRASAKLAEAVVAQHEPPGRSGAARETSQLRERFEEAMATLKSQEKGKNLYELPWYVIIGPPGSGKTTALVNSGLKFPLEQRFGREALRGVGGTRNCDWWFTDEAVLLDTAGRYTTQDSDESADSAGWAEFLKLLTRYRKRRPLNGVMVTLSAADLMTGTAQERDANIAAVRRRLDELNRNLKLRLPVYVLVTKCDLISGFAEYFEDLDAEGRAQVWGMTFKAERSQSGKAPEDFAGEFDALVERLNRRLFERIEDARDVRRRAAVYAFPQQLAGLRNLIGAFIQEVFAATRFDGRLLLRGVYFTSGTQEGTPIDRMIAAIGRGFALSSDAYSGGAPGRGKSYFIERLLREVIFAEAGLAGVNRARELQLAAAQLAGYAATLLIAALAVILLSVSFNANKTYLADVNKSLDALNGLTPPTARQDLGDVVPWLDAVRSIDEAANRYAGHLAWSMRFGLFQGGTMGDAAHDAYVRELNGALLPRLAEAFKQRLLAAAAEPDKLYQYLKAYLMLGEPQHLDKPQLTFLASLDWQDRYANQPEVLQSLGTHLANLIDGQDTLRPLPLDDTLVAQTRNTVRQASLPRLMYDQLKLSKMDDKSHDVRLNIEAGLGADSVFVRKSGRKLSDPIPGLYTRVVFDQVSAAGTVALIKQFSEDSWVMGDSAFDLQGAARMTTQVMDLYADEYIQVWDGVLNDIHMTPLRTLAQTANVLGTIGGKGSPLKGFLLIVDKNTNLTKPLEGDQAKPGMMASAEKAVMDPLTKLFRGKPGQAAGPTAAERITTHFAAVDQLVAGPPGGTQIDGVLAQIDQMHTKMSGLGTGVGETNPLDALSKGGTGGDLRALQLQASTLPAPIGALVAEVGGRSESLTLDQARGELDRRYHEQVVNACQQIITNRYPFFVGSAVDVPVADFARLFAAGGVFDAFFKENLAALVDSSQTPWVWRAGGSGPAGASSSMLHQFELVQQIRDNYFATSASLPEQQFTLTPGDLDVGTTRFTLEVDGQSLDYRHGPVRSIPAKWPGPSPGAASVIFEDSSGAGPNLNFVGPWAWFRLLDAAQIRPESDVRLTAVFRLAGHSGAVIVEAPSIRNPYQKAALRQFRCGS
jgi:type VI secretion system protein ImpL